MKTNKLEPRHEIKNTSHKHGKSKQTNSCKFKDDEITKTNERILEICENHLFN